MGWKNRGVSPIQFFGEDPVNHLIPGDLVRIIPLTDKPKYHPLGDQLGVIIEKHPLFSYSHWRVLFPECGVLDCRASDLVVIS